jgi:hypothetical protein
MYQVWTKDEYEEKWSKQDCESLEEARQAILLAIRGGEQPLLTQEVGYEMQLKIREGEVSPDKSKAKSRAKDKAEKTEEVTGEITANTPEPGPGTGD